MTMFLKVLNKVNFRVFILKPKLFIIDLLQFAKFLVLLAINHKFVLKEDFLHSLVVEVLPCSGCFMTCMGGHYPVGELDNAICFGTLSRMLGL